MKSRYAWAAAGLLGGLVAALMFPTSAQTPGPEPSGAERTITVSGMAVVRRAPDEAVVTLGVQSEALTAEEAMGENAERMTAVLRALGNLGITGDDLATSGINLWPRYGSDGMHVTGYTAQNQVNVTVRNLDRIGRLIDASVAAGANLTSGVVFRLSDESAGREGALAEAVADAREKAEALAGAAGAQVGQVLTVHETASGFPPPVFFEERAVAAEGGTPIEPPHLETQVSVTVTWAMA